MQYESYQVFFYLLCEELSSVSSHIALHIVCILPEFIQCVLLVCTPILLV